jgi:hypothetical protein
MTQGEKLVWAAAFAHHAFSLPPDVKDQDRANGAALMAQMAVRLMRIAECPDGEENCDTVQMLRSMQEG